MPIPASIPQKPDAFGLGRLCNIKFGVVMFLCILSLPTQAAREQLGEYQVKAVFLFNFAQFVEWPPQSFTNPESPLVVGILGADPFGSILDEAVRGEIAHERRLVIRRHLRPNQVADCHLLFVPAAEAARWRELQPLLAHRSVLTIGETEGFAANGGMIEFTRNQGRIRLKINQAAAQAAGLQISSKLLRVADVVVAPGQP